MIVARSWPPFARGRHLHRRVNALPARFVTLSKFFAGDVGDPVQPRFVNVTKYVSNYILSCYISFVMREFGYWCRF